MARAGKSLLGSSGPRAADNLGRGQKLRAAAGQRAALAGALSENLLTHVCVVVAFCFRTPKGGPLPFPWPTNRRGHCRRILKSLLARAHLDLLLVPSAPLPPR